MVTTAIHNLLPVAASTFIIYIFLIVGFRTVGRRQLGQLTIIDLVIIIVMGSAVETAMVHGDTSLPAGLVSAGTLLLTNRLIAFASARSKRFRRLVSGGPLLLVHYGKVLYGHLRRSGVTERDLDVALHARGFNSVSDVKFAVLEEDGEINVISMEKKSLHTPNIARTATTTGTSDSVPKSPTS